LCTWLENDGNGTKAAMLAYGCSTPNATAVIASRLLRNVNIKRAIEEEMAGQGLSLKWIVQELSNCINAEPTLEGKVKGLELLLKLVD
jgi:hypothetical protein